MNTPAHKVIKAFGTGKRAAKAVGRADNYFSRLITEGDGVVPIRMASAVVEVAERESLDLTWNDMRPPASALDLPPAAGAAADEGAAA
ncbi:hypothetical protein [Euryhalocaulis caribicus]|uniref:hypothetical protein n=1 Tax=Euryhalocaulis caribicus TaxID=1161401 RepID=UPI00039B17FF|nr:hypothetical protein [Euryhalocaulis caribicus]